MTKYHSIILLTAYYILSSLSLGAQDATITLIDTIAVEAPDIKLGAIATIQTENSALKKRLASLVVGEAPRLNNSRLISAYKVKALLNRHSLENVEVQGQQSIVSTLSKKISREELKQLIENWVKKQLPCEQEIDLQFVSIPKEWEVPSGKCCDITLNSHSRDLIGNCALMLQANCGKNCYATTRARLNIELYQEGLVLIRPLRRGEKLTHSHLEKRRCPLTKTTGMEVVHIESILDMEAKRDLAIGHQPTIQDFEKPIVIEQGSQNRIVVLNDGLSLNLDGAIALQNGKEGENILFQNPMNKKEPLRAQVVRPGLAVIRINQVTRM